MTLPQIPADILSELRTPVHPVGPDWSAVLVGIREGVA